MTRRRATRTARPLRWRASWWPTWLLWIGAKKSFYQYKEKTAPPRSTVPKISGGFLQRAACQVSSVADWTTERKLPMPPSNCFETGRGHKLNLL